MALLEDLKQRTNMNIATAQQLRLLDSKVLNMKKDADSWSILECIEHLNLYGDYYLPEIRKEIEKSNTVFKEEFRSGLLGNYFANLMLPKEGMQKMKTFKDKNPANSHLTVAVIDRFIELTTFEWTRS
ncbi:MAG: hypothetical protein ACKOXB_14785 [Flavobacteriales bacterium]